MAGEPDPTWPTDAARAVGHEIANYARTLGRILRTPRQFAADWSDGKLAALNPLAFLFNSLAVLGPWRAMWGRILDPNPVSTPIWFELAKPLFPVVLNTVITAIAHSILWPLGARRPLRSSIAMNLYVAGGPLAVFHIVLAPLGIYGYLHRTEPLGLFASLSNLVLLVVFFGYLVVMAAAVQRMSRWRVGVALLFAWTLWAFASAWISAHHPDAMRAILEG